jgi:Trypsin-co-occurring domain 1
MAGKLMPMRIGDVEVLVEAMPVAGTEPTSGLDKAKDKVTDAFDRAKATIVAMGESTADVIKRLTTGPAAHPDTVEVEFGLAFSAKGNVVVAEASAQATLKVKLTYTIPKQTP